jgi:hypothetical protein
MLEPPKRNTSQAKETPMGQIKQILLEATDADYFQALQTIEESELDQAIGLNCLTLTFPLSLREPIQKPSVAEANEDVEIRTILQAGGATFESMQLGSGQCNVKISRHHNHQNPEQSRPPDLTFTFVDSKDDVKKSYPIVFARIQKAISSVSPNRIGTLLGDDARKHYDARDLALTRLETAHSTLLHDFEAIKKQHYADLDTRRKALDSEHEARQKELAIEHQKRLEQLEVEREELSKEKARLDDRSSTHVRRELRDKLKEILTQRQTSFSLSKDTARRRRFVFGGYLFVLLCLAGLAGYYLWLESQTTGTPNYWNIGRQLAATLGFFITVGFFLRWMNSWAQQHAEEEFRLKQLEVDLDRASWVVEMAFEWDESKDNPIPEKLIDTLSSNLFGESAKTKDSAMTPGDAVARTLAGLPNAAAELHFPGGKLSLDKKGMKEVKRSAAADD